ncbi:MAG: hypothetical protein AAFR14_08810 [Bacteroidota bacterium]
MDVTRKHILQTFDDIEPTDHVNRVRFYEKHTSIIFTLDEYEQYYFSWQYINSLFELGKNESVLAEVDPVIEYVFMNEANFGGISTFEDLLFKKASSHFHILEYPEAIAITEQLVGIDPDNALYQLLAMRAHRALFNWRSTAVRLTALMLIFSSSIVSAIFWLMTSSGQQSSLWLTFLVVVSPCLLALGILGGAYGWSYLRSIRLVKQLVQKKKAKSLGGIS